MTQVQVTDISIRRGARAIVEGLSFTAAPGAITALMGASGAGKTTVLRALAGLEPIDRGQVDLGDMRLQAGPLLRGAARRALHRRVGMVFQFHELFAHMTALRNVALALVHVLEHSQDEADRRARQLLDSLGVADRGQALPHELSGGEAQRVAIARALAVDPAVLLMDEPTASLDPARRGELAVLLRQLAGAGRTIIVATHDLELARTTADAVVVME